MVSGIKIHHRDTQDTGEKHGEKKKKEKKEKKKFNHR
jgi:hypothetical protein